MASETGVRSSSGFDEIPVVDLSPMGGSADERVVLAAELRDICHHVGFFLAVNHGIEPSFIDDIFRQMRQLFALPLDDKQRIDKRLSPHFRGWEAVGAESTNNRPDMREQVDLWSEWPRRELAETDPAYLHLYGPNQWLPEDVLAGQRPLLGEWFERMGSLADQILGLLSLGLGFGDDHLVEYFGDQPMSLTKLISYPETPPGHAGVNAHHDAGFLTVLAPGETPGLQVQNPVGDWIDVPIVAGSLVINLGEMLQGISGQYFVATPHRVITAEPRLSAAYFHGPSLDAELDPWPLDQRFVDAVAASPRHAQAGFMAARAETEAGVGDMQSRHRPSTYGEQLWNYFARSYPDNMARHYPSNQHEEY